MEATRWRNHAFIFGTGNLAAALNGTRERERGEKAGGRGLLRPGGKCTSTRYRPDPAKSSGIKRRRRALEERETREPTYSAAFQTRRRLFTRAFSISVAKNGAHKEEIQLELERLLSDTLKKEGEHTHTHTA